MQMKFLDLLRSLFTKPAQHAHSSAVSNELANRCVHVWEGLKRSGVSRLPSKSAC